MKLSLDDLKVDSYAIQVSESELAEVKGGTAWLCFDAGVAIATLLVAGYNAFKGDPLKVSGGASGGSSGGNTTWVYGADSVRVTNPNGSTTTYYGIDSLSVNH